jgi:hypothetical protein
MEATGPTIDVSSFGGGHYRTCRQHPPGGPTIDIFNIGDGRCRKSQQQPQGVRHQRLQHRWWPLSNLPPAPPRGPTIDVSSFGGDRCRTYHQHPPGGLPLTSSTSVVVVAGSADSTPQEARHRRLQLWWWPLLDLPTTPPRGPAIDVSNSGGGCYRKSRQHPQGPHRRRFAKLGTCRQHFSADTYQGPTAVNITTTSKTTWRKSGGKSFSENFSGPCGAKNSGIIIPLYKLSPN